MEKFVAEVFQDHEKVLYEIRDYAYDENNRCKFEVFLDDRLVASFEPDSKGFLHICKNPGNVDEATLHGLAEKIESYNL